MEISGGMHVRRSAAGTRKITFGPVGMLEPTPWVRFLRNPRWRFPDAASRPVNSPVQVGDMNHSDAFVLPLRRSWHWALDRSLVSGP
jgi:hypothetical protein